MAVQEKCLADSTSREYVQSGLMQFLKLCLNLCSWPSLTMATCYGRKKTSKNVGQHLLNF